MVVPAGPQRVGVPAPGADLPRGSGGRRLPPEGGRGGAMTLVRGLLCYNWDNPASTVLPTFNGFRLVPEHPGGYNRGGEG